MKKLMILAGIFLLAGCGNFSKNHIEKEKAELSKKAENINSDLLKIRNEVKWLAGEITGLYLKQDSILPLINKSKYQLALNGVLTKITDDGGSAVFVSGYYPINEEVKNVVYLTEPIDPVFKKIVNKYPEIVQVYYNDKSAVNRIYPYFDVLSQYEAKMDIPSFNFYFLADSIHNPERESVWVAEPYIDPAGRGWMISAIAPVYYKNKLAGVPGVDITVNTITDRYVHGDGQKMTMIIDSSATIVSAQEAIINLLAFPPLTDHKYIETIKQDTYRKGNYNLRLSREEFVRDLAHQTLDLQKKEFELSINGNTYTVISAIIPETKWCLLKILN